tara:strand:+ start:669 stop:1034 length:366 start_codon:yes stop_codon:yes gene_type:complete
MAHYAEIDTNNKVINIIAGVDENEKSGAEILYLLLTGNYWKRTSYNTHGGVHSLGGTPFRKNYASIGFTYDETRNAFIAPQSYPSWTLNEDTCQWEAPVEKPDDGKMYTWNEDTINWTEVV